MKKNLIVLLMFVSSIVYGTDAIFNGTTNVNIGNGKLQESSANLIPAGSLMMYASTNAPNGWFLCDGTQYSTTTYSSLWLAIGYSYSTGTGSGFNVPNMKGRVGVGFDVASSTSFARVGGSGGEQTHTLITAEMPAHVHSIDARPDDASVTGSWYIGSVQTTQVVTSLDTVSAGSGVAHNNLQPYVVVNYIIKY